MNPKSPAQDCALTRSELGALFGAPGMAHRVLRPDVASGEAVLRGRMALTSLREGLQIKRADLYDLYDMTTQAEVGESLHLVLALDGLAEAQFGARTLRLDARKQASAALLALAQPEAFERRSRCGNYQRKLSITLSPAWLEASGLSGEGRRITQLCRQHLALVHWQPARRIADLAEQMMQPPPCAPELQRLYLESRALEVIAAAFAEITGEPAAPSAGASHDRRLLRVREMIDGGEAEAMSLHEIARQAGLSARTLQLQFRRAFGESVFEYLRGRRLDRAREAIEHLGLPIGLAAHQAGYTSAANFATAFRRRFGLSPRQAQRS